LLSATSSSKSAQLKEREGGMARCEGRRKLRTRVMRRTGDEEEAAERARVVAADGVG
jgi:hypothetical protein